MIAERQLYSDTHHFGLYSTIFELALTGPQYLRGWITLLNATDYCSCLAVMGKTAL